MSRGPLLVEPSTENPPRRLRPTDLDPLAAPALLAMEYRPRSPPNLTLRREPNQAFD